MKKETRWSGLARVVSTSTLLVVGTVWLVGCPETIPPPDGGDGGGDGGGVIDVTNKNFVGADTCKLCHKSTHDEWSQTLHVGALETLEAIGQGANAQCVGCHTVGFGQTDGFVSKTATPYLAGVQCENCHGAGGNHYRDPLNDQFTPQISIAADVCGACHTGSHHPNVEQWTESGHATVVPDVAADLIEGGSFVNNCGICHSGDVFYSINIKGETVPEDAFVTKTPEELTPVTCAICHDPHARTGFAATPDEGRDFQLRFRQVASPTPSNTIEDVTNPQRFNLCGQCHHDRGRTWETTTRAPHHSNQANVYAGEMPVSDLESQDPLVLGRVSVHSFAPEQCSTCHMYRQDFQSEEAPEISGHNFTINNAGCAASGCHPSSESAIQAQALLQTEVSERFADIVERLGDPTTWEYTAAGGPDADGQALLSDQLKQARFLYYYALNDGSLGVHNPAYVRSMIEKAEALLTEAGR